MRVEGRRSVVKKFLLLALYFKLQCGYSDLKVQFFGAKFRSKGDKCS